MPKIVDHDQRRSEIIEAIWTLMARQGIEGLTMREIAAEIGLSNGALARYFPNKATMMRAALERATAATDERAAAKIGDRTGIEALRLLCLEVMPLDEVRLTEARVVIGFWAYAATDPSLVAVFDSAMQRWRNQMEHYLRQEDDNGGCLDEFLNTLMAMLMGLQINAVFLPRHNTPPRQVAALDALISTRLRHPSDVCK